MDPLDPGAAPACVGRSARPHDEDRQAIAPSVEDTQQAVHESDVRVQHDRHCPIRRLGIAVRDRQRVILVQAQQQLRVAVSEIVDQAVVKAAKAGTGVERDVLEVEPTQHLGRDVAAPRHAVLPPGAGRSIWSMLVMSSPSRARSSSKTRSFTGSGRLRPPDRRTRATEDVSRDGIMTPSVGRSAGGEHRRGTGCPRGRRRSNGRGPRPRRPQEHGGRTEQERERAIDGYQEEQDQRARGQAPRAGGATAPMLPPLQLALPYYEVLDEEGVERIHDASMADPGGGRHRLPGRRGDRVLEGGAGRHRRIPGAHRSALLMELIAKAPETFTFTARNPERSVPSAGAAWCSCRPTARRSCSTSTTAAATSTLDDLHQFHKLAHLSPSMHLSGGIICEPVDVAVPKRHLHVVHSLLRHSDKPFMGATTARERAEDTVAMARIAFGDDFVANHTVLAGVLNCNSPLVWDATMLDALKVYAASNQAVIASPFVMAGASTAASTVGAVAQLNAEALAGVAFAQLVRAGAPMIYGQFLATVDMQSGAPMAGTPEISLMNFIVGQLARRYRLPWRSSGMTAGSKLVDAQAAYESSMTMQSVLLSARTTSSTPRGGSREA